MKTVEHELWPVSFIHDDGRRIDALWSFKPNDPTIWCGEPFKVSAQHGDPAEMNKAARIAELEQKLAKLKGAA